MRTRSVMDQPELNIAIFAFLLNYPWELLQVPLYALAPATPAWSVIERCSVAAVGDAAIMLVAFLMIALPARSRWWFLRPTRGQVFGFVFLGLLITVSIEHVATTTDPAHGGWRYGPSMPVFPLVGIGLAPLLQWLILPPLSLWFVRRQLAHLRALPPLATSTEDGVAKRGRRTDRLPISCWNPPACEGDRHSFPDRSVLAQCGGRRCRR